MNNKKTNMQIPKERANEPNTPTPFYPGSFHCLSGIPSGNGMTIRQGGQKGLSIIHHPAITQKGLGTFLISPFSPVPTGLARIDHQSVW